VRSQALQDSFLSMLQALHQVGSSSPAARARIVCCTTRWHWPARSCSSIASPSS
jgi:hypothetical protein